MTGFESIVGVDPWTALFTFLNMLITFAILGKFLFKPVKKMIDERQKAIDDTYAGADAAKKAAEELKAEYESKLEDAKSERDEIVHQASGSALASAAAMSASVSIRITIICMSSFVAATAH